MNLAYKKILGKFTKVLGFGKTPPHVGKNSQIISFFFLRAYLIQIIRQRAGLSSPDAIPAHFKELGTGGGVKIRFINRYI